MQKKVALLGSVWSLIAQENISSGQDQSSLHRGHVCKTKSDIVTVERTMKGLKIEGAICCAECKALYGKCMILAYIKYIYRTIVGEKKSFLQQSNFIRGVAQSKKH